MMSIGLSMGDNRLTEIVTLSVGYVVSLLAEARGCFSQYALGTKRGNTYYKVSHTVITHSMVKGVIFNMDEPFILLFLLFFFSFPCKPTSREVNFQTSCHGWTRIYTILEVAMANIGELVRT